MNKLTKYTAQFLAGLVTAQAVEYVIHDYVLHRLGEDKDSSLYFHTKHHQRVSWFGTDPIYSKIFKFDIDRAKEVLMLFTPTIMLNTLYFEKFPAFAAGLTAGSFLYYFSHAIAHKDPEIGCKLIPSHMVHHYGNPHDDFGVTSGLVDNLVRLVTGETGKSKEERLEIMKRGLKRYHERKSLLEKAALEREAEQRKLISDVAERVGVSAFNGVMDAVNYVGKVRWKLERMVRDVERGV